MVSNKCVPSSGCVPPVLRCRLEDVYMNRSSTTFRITIGLACLATSALFLADVLGLIPNARVAALRGRSALCEALAINTSLLATDQATDAVEATLKCVVERNKELLSAGVRSTRGTLLVEVGAHEDNWHLSAKGVTNDSHLYVPITAGDNQWGTLELRFAPLESHGWLGKVWNPRIRLFVFVAAGSMILFFVYLTKTLAHLDPSRVIPDRVRTALDTLAEGLLVLDKNERIVHANKAFTDTVGHAAEDLQGKLVTELPWGTSAEGPWKTSVDGEANTGVVMELHGADARRRTFKVNTSPIFGQKGEYRGALASFDDVTDMERSRVELERMLDDLSKSRDEIHRQNKELEVLATRDPLTGCLNRRSFFTDFEMHWDMAERHGQALSVLMVDIDHFKLINDNHGHSVGDAVLTKVGEILNTAVREGDLVCRYGGEEFCVVMPFATLESSLAVAERIRMTIEATEFGDVRATASIGLSNSLLGGRDPQEAMDQADKCLYVAKRQGRNQCVSFDGIPADFAIDEAQESRGVDDSQDASAMIPFNAATALISALAYRDSPTAEHSRRVADLCVAVGEGLMPISECYVLEIAALLHDIGKIGVPDAILLKQRALTEDEWKIMCKNDRIGTEIIRAAFDSPLLNQIMSFRHTWYSGASEGPTKEEIHIGARILAIADAYDSMVSDRVYRKGRSSSEAFAELRRCAGTQFDPILVEHFIHVMKSREAQQEIDSPEVSKETALRIGIQIERLAVALDSRNLPDLEARAGRLKKTAGKYGIEQIALVAEKLEHAAGEDCELKELVDLATELLKLCRTTQRAYLVDDKSELPSA